MSYFSISFVLSLVLSFVLSRSFQNYVNGNSHFSKTMRGWKKFSDSISVPKGVDDKHGEIVNELKNSRTYLRFFTQSDKFLPKETAFMALPSFLMPCSLPIRTDIARCVFPNSNRLLKTHPRSLKNNLKLSQLLLYTHRRHSEKARWLSLGCAID